MAKVYETPAQHAEHGEAHEDHTGLYVLVGVILAIVTAVEVVWPAIGLRSVELVTGLVALMILKGALVVLYFMHLKGDPNVFKFLFVVPLLIAVLFVLTFLGLFNGSHFGVAG